MFVTTLFTTVKEVEVNPSIVEWANTVWYTTPLTHNGTLFSLERKGILTNAVIEVNPEDTVLSEMSPLQKDKLCVMSFICGSLE